MKKPLTEEQIRAIVEGVIAGSSYNEIASQIGIHRETVSKYVRKSHIKEEIERRKSGAIAPKIEAYAQINRKREEDAEKWKQSMISHSEDMLKTAKTLRIGGMNTITRTLNAIAKYDMTNAKLSELSSLLRVANELATASYELEAEALGVYELMEKLNEHNKELEG